MYATGDGTPNVFGSNIYLVRTEAFDFLKKNSALMASKVSPSEIQSGNIVIFKLENGKPAIAQVIDADLSDGVYSFSVLTENNSRVTLSQSQVVAKGMSYSEFLGAVISFAVSPLGMLVIAIVPSIIIIILELVRFAGKIMPQPEVDTIKKQYEVPTYSPSLEKNAREKRSSAEAVRAYRNSSLDGSIGIYDKTGRDTAAERRQPSHEMSGDYAAIAARQQAGRTASPLYTSPTRQTRRPSAPRVTMPLSAKKLDKAIEATKAEHELDDMNKMRSQIVKDIQKTRGAVIAAEKELETSEKNNTPQARRTSSIVRTNVIDELSKERTSEIARDAARSSELRRAASRTSALQTEKPRPTLTPPSSQSKRILRPSQRSAPEPPVRQYEPGHQTGSTTSIPRLDSLLSEDSDSGTSYNIDDILAGLGRRG